MVANAADRGEKDSEDEEDEEDDLKTEPVPVVLRSILWSRYRQHRWICIERRAHPPRNILAR